MEGYVAHSYKKDDWLVKARHAIQGLIFGSKTITEDDDKVTHVTYIAHTEEKFILALKRGITRVAQSQEDTDIYTYALIRTGEAPNFHYFPLPKLVEQVKSGKAARWQKRKLRQVHHFLGVKP